MRDVLKIKLPKEKIMAMEPHDRALCSYCWDTQQIKLRFIQSLRSSRRITIQPMK